MLGHLEVLVEDEAVPRDTAEWALRCLRYGAP